ncbi:MAG: polysaccharide biosynthesis C-terminal domain-containing protein [Actinomycetota bacterium]
MRVRAWLRFAVPLTALRGLGQAMEFVGWVLIARQIGPDQFGPLTVAFVVARYAGLLADWGAERRGARDVAAGSGSARALVAQRGRLADGLAVAFAVGAVIAGTPWAAPLAAVTWHGGRNVDWVALGAVRSRRASAAALARGGAMVAIGVAIAERDQITLAVGVAYLFATGVSHVAARPELAKLPAATPGLVDAWALMITALAAVYTVMDSVLVAALSGAGDAGVYGAVMRVPFGLATIAGLAVAALLPLVTRAVATEGRSPWDVARPAATASAAVAALLIVVSVPAAFLAVEVFGAEYVDGRWPLVILLWAQALAIGSAPLGAVLLSVGGDRGIAHIVAFAAGLNVVGNVALIPLFGMIAAASTTVLAEAVVYVLFVRALRSAPTREELLV